MVTALFQHRSPQLLTPEPLALAGTELSISRAKHFTSGKTCLSGRISPLSAAQTLGSTLPGQPFGHDSIHTRGTQALCHHPVASEETSSVAFEKLLKSSFSVMWFKMLFSESNGSAGRCSSGNQKHEQKFWQWFPEMIKMKMSLKA